MYQPIDVIQTGSFSSVYRAYDTRTGEYVALKVVVKPKNKEQLETIRKLVENEHKVLKRLGSQHPNICAMLDFYQDAEKFVFVLEYCHHGDFYDYMKRVKEAAHTRSGVHDFRNVNAQLNGLPRINFHSLIQQLCSALRYCHSLGIAHRDLKPENILVTNTGTLKLTDFGLSCMSRQACDYGIGTEKYLAPETFSHTDGYSTYEADFWSLGISILYIMFGSCPFKSANVNYCKKNTNFVAFNGNPIKFVKQYYLAALFDKSSTTEIVLPGSEYHKLFSSPAFWLEIVTEISDARDVLLQISSLVVSHLLCSPTHRDVETFWNKLDFLFKQQQSCYQLTPPNSSSSSNSAALLSKTQANKKEHTNPNTLYPPSPQSVNSFSFSPTLPGNGFDFTEDWLLRDFSNYSSSCEWELDTVWATNGKPLPIPSE